MQTIGLLHIPRSMIDPGGRNTRKTPEEIEIAVVQVSDSIGR